MWAKKKYFNIEDIYSNNTPSKCGDWRGRWWKNFEKMLKKLNNKKLNEENAIHIKIVKYYAYYANIIHKKL